MQEQLLKDGLVKKSKVAEAAPSAGQTETERDRLMEVVKTHSLGQISHALYDAGGEYHRNM